MEENKYYTPELDDIHTGFEYEYLNSKGAWIKCDDFSNAYDYEDNPHYGIQKDIENKKIRVKYLDKEDIEAEGFGFLKEDERRFIFRKKINYQEGRFEKTITELLYNPLNNWCLIYIGDEETMIIDFKTIFAGHIKNKSEFRKLLKMINV